MQKTKTIVVNVEPLRNRSSLFIQGLESQRDGLRAMLAEATKFVSNGDVLTFEKVKEGT